MNNRIDSDNWSDWIILDCVIYCWHFKIQCVFYLYHKAWGLPFTVLSSYWEWVNSKVKETKKQWTKPIMILLFNNIIIVKWNKKASCTKIKKIITINALLSSYIISRNNCKLTPRASICIAIILTTIEQKCGGGVCVQAATLWPSMSPMRSPRMSDCQQKLKPFSIFFY